MTWILLIDLERRSTYDSSESMYTRRGIIFYLGRSELSIERNQNKYKSGVSLNWMRLWKLRMSKQNAVYGTSIVIGLLYFTFIIVIALEELTIQFLGQDWWDNFSLLSDILAIMFIGLNFLLHATGRLRYDPKVFFEEFLDQLDEKGWEIRLKQNYTARNEEIPEKLDSAFAIKRVSSFAEELERRSFDTISREFRDIQNLLSNELVIDAILRTRRAFESLIRFCLYRLKKIPNEKAGKFHHLLRIVERSIFLKPYDKESAVAFWKVASRASHATWTPSDERQIMAMIATIVSISEGIIFRAFGEG